MLKTIMYYASQCIINRRPRQAAGRGGGGRPGAVYGGSSRSQSLPDGRRLSWARSVAALDRWSVPYVRGESRARQWGQSTVAVRVVSMPRQMLASRTARPAFPPAGAGRFIPPLPESGGEGGRVIYACCPVRRRPPDAGSVPTVESVEYGTVR